MLTILINDNHVINKEYQYRANNLAFFNVYRLNELRRHHLKEFVALRSLRVSNATINRELSYAKAAINCVNYDFELSINNPFSKFKLKEADTIPNYLTRNQYQKLLTASMQFNNTDLHDFIVLLTMTGARPKELLTLTWGNVHLDDNQFVVRNFHSKSGKTLFKFLNETAKGVLLERARQGEYVFMNTRTGQRFKSFKKGFQLCKARARVDCTMYDLRHTYASWLVQKGVPIYTVKELLGHDDIVSTLRYAHLDYDTKLQALYLIG